MGVQDCCSPFHQGAWTRNAVELAVARVSGALLGLTGFLADTTHSDRASDTERERGRGRGRRRLEVLAEREISWYQQYKVRLLDMCAGPAEDEPGGASTAHDDTWIVLLWLEGTDKDDGSKQCCVQGHRYVKHQGRWLFLKSERSVPTYGPFRGFAEKYLSDEQQGSDSSQEDDDAVGATFSDTWQAKAGMQPDGSAWPFTFDLVSPSYAPQGATEDELLGPWLWDDLAIEAEQPAAWQAGKCYPRRRQLVYLDDYAASRSAEGAEVDTLSAEQKQLLFALTGEQCSDSEGLSIRRAALFNHQLRQRLSSLRNPHHDESTWMFRTGRFQKQH